jgi:hypothetical protein
MQRDDDLNQEEQHRCQTCGELFAGEDQLAAHQRQTHGDELTPETPGQLD